MRLWHGNVFIRTELCASWRLSQDKEKSVTNWGWTVAGKFREPGEKSKCLSRETLVGSKEAWRQEIIRTAV